MKNQNAILIILFSLVFVVTNTRSSNAQQEISFLSDEANTISIFKTVSPSVAFITTSTRVSDFFYFDETEQIGSGSGVVWNNKGHIVTNYHVIENADKVTVSLAQNGEQIPAKLVGVDPSKDIAVLKIDVSEFNLKLKPLAIGTSNNLEVGQKVLAIGNPFGLDRTLTTGVVSALGREIKSTSKRSIHNVIQTDASINPGNSGGPLLDSKAKVIGINTQIYSPSGASAGIGFAIPIDTVKRIVTQIIDYGKVSIAGVNMRTLSDSIARNNGINGIVIVEFNSKINAKSGIKNLRRNKFGNYSFDVITAVNNIKVKTIDDLLTEFEKYKPGDVVTLSILRDAKNYDNIKVTLEDVGVY